MKLSVITVCYNNLPGLVKTQESIVCQTCHDYEWLIIDGNSDDGTKEYLEKLAPQPDYWSSTPDTGIYNAMNKGIALSHGEYLLFLNSGDTLVNQNVLENVVGQLNGADVVYGDAVFWETDKHRMVHYPDNFTIYDFWNTYTPCHQASFIKASLLKTSGYDERYRIVADYRKWIEWKIEGKVFHHLPVIVCNYMLDGISTTNRQLHQQEHDAVVNDLFNSTMREQMEQVDRLKEFYEDAVARRDDEIARRDDEIARRDDEIARRDDEITHLNYEVTRRDAALLNRKSGGRSKKKKVLIDLYSLENPYCGFGQIAVNYAKLFGDVQRLGLEDFDIAFLLPYRFHKKNNSLADFRDVECYYEDSWLHHVFHQIPHKIPNVDLWHSVNQFCRHYPKTSATKHVFTIHDYNFLFEETPERQKDFLSVMQQRIDRADAITFISHYTEQVVKDHSQLENKLTRVIYNGVESLREHSRQQPAFVVPNKPFFFAIGQFLPKKKFDLLLDMMSFFPDRELYICGQNSFPYGKEILRRIHDEHLSNVHAPGSISDDERVWLFANCEAYLFPSIGEGFGLPAIEAMQFGKPVFSSNYQSLPEIVANHGYVWPTLDPAVMAHLLREGLTEFSSNPEKKQQVMAFAANFSYRKHVESYLQLYRELLF